MSKLPQAYRFFDISDYGRPMARFIANRLKHTWVTPIHVTIGFIISGLLAIGFILNHHYWAATFFLILKSILDAADGELARMKKTPSYTGRYFDSISDILINLLLILTIRYVTHASLLYALLAFIGLQLQGTLYNYYYVILRNMHNGDTTSRVFENKPPIAMKGEKQSRVNFLFKLYSLFYGFFDKTIHWLDKNAVKDTYWPNWFMTLVSSFGLGFQLLLIGLFMILGQIHLIIPFFICCTIFIFIFISIRRSING
ncbi:CDP-alcohol phosphatidyltransferase family protein [Maribacter polysaccharolyticus]|uniref:CDP-alcohol phosphatidyltransferase family protein n=1 Tax=Maribacter polysaccharolyticus TaxID=3020831 RepID=UPI00237FD320|nr:CDP-alcohol phosphatidyltransferase family protein [Maribacter polysaccharolyticus]MDE3740777.1 CDP-alcohol phosphatidyltransferase family protein [Maribacter polysaccharolyticus]